MAKYNYKKAVQGLLTKTTKTFVGKDGQEYTFKFDNVFSKEKKGAFIKEFISIKKECDTRKENPNYDVVYECLLVKYFTDAIPKKTGNVYDVCIHGLDIINDLRELGLYENILLGLNIECVKELNDDFNNQLKAMQKIVEKYIEENKDVFING